MFADLMLNESIGKFMLEKELSGDWTVSPRCWENLSSLVFQLRVQPLAPWMLLNAPRERRAPKFQTQPTGKQNLLEVFKTTSLFPSSVQVIQYSKRKPKSFTGHQDWRCKLTVQQTWTRIHLNNEFYLKNYRCYTFFCFIFYCCR